MRKTKDYINMSEGAHRFWDTLIKLGTAIVGLIVVWTGIAQYKEESQKNIATQQIEQQKLEIERTKLLYELSKSKSEALLEAARAIATIATAKDKNEVKKAKDTFLRIYYADLVVMGQGPLVESAMIQNARLLLLATGGLNQEQKDILKQTALELSTACRRERERDLH
jgi:hypothetical protein